MAVQSVDIYDSLGNVIWSKDALGRVTYSAYDSITGNMTYSIADISSATASSLGLPSGKAAAAPQRYLKRYL